MPKTETQYPILATKSDINVNEIVSIIFGKINEHFGTKNKHFGTINKIASIKYKPPSLSGSL